MHEGLLEAIHDLVEAHGVMLHRLADAPGARGEEVSLSVGPFAGTEAVPRFTQSLAAMELARESRSSATRAPIGRSWRCS